jgi:hypothetical protein
MAQTISVSQFPFPSDDPTVLTKVTYHMVEHLKTLDTHHQALKGCSFIFP